MAFLGRIYIHAFYEYVAVSGADHRRLRAAISATQIRAPLYTANVYMCVWLLCIDNILEELIIREQLALPEWTPLERMPSIDG